ncbi:MAG: hypothetical protein KJ600_01020, partial [Nanoarchaeota archaeon]|nr:hypothetical protein [Nanoarchaeota archaeon]MBU1103123.1 hypothetical protein [Nanoarchaeota archaeon]
MVNQEELFGKLVYLRANYDHGLKIDKKCSTQTQDQRNWLFMVGLAIEAGVRDKILPADLGRGYETVCQNFDNPEMPESVAIMEGITITENLLEQAIKQIQPVPA